MTICPKCQYKRVASDVAPDWQCPNCGVAYNKVAGPTNPTNVRDKEQTGHVAEPGMSGKKVILILFLVLLAGFGYWKTKQAHSNAAEAPVSARFDAAKKAFEAHDFPAATKEFSALAVAGDAKAQYYLGRIYALDWSRTGFDGKVTRQPSDREKSITWFKKAAEQGELLAQIELGDLYRHNRGGGTNPDREAAKWYQMAADQGDANAEYLIGTFYEHGTGVAKDAAQASRWYRAAAEQGHGGGLFGLGMLHARGEGVSASPLMAYKLLLLAAARNDRDPSVEGAFWAKERSKEVARQLSGAQLAEADELVATWRPGQPLPR